MGKWPCPLKTMGVVGNSGQDYIERCIDKKYPHDHSEAEGKNDDQQGEHNHDHHHREQGNGQPENDRLFPNVPIDLEFLHGYTTIPIR